MKVLLLTLFVGFLGFTPVYMFNELVLPQLNALSESYQGYDAYASKIADTP